VSEAIFDQQSGLVDAEANPVAGTGLWPFVIGKGMRSRDGTREVTRILKSWTLKDFQIKANWRKLVALVQVAPDADISRPISPSPRGQIPQW